ncbi:hypothetical protein Tco_1279803, partial [Tanacetum coccineum]
VQRIENKAKTLTGGPAVAPVTASRPRGTTQVVTRGTINDWYEVAGTGYFIEVACTGVRVIRGGRYEVAWNVRWQYEVAAAGQSEHDTCPKRVIRGCQACVSPRLSCRDPRQ